jgi:hypothetical protein
MTKQRGAALRMRRTRARQRRGLISVRLDVDEYRIAAALVAHGKLTEEQALRPGLVGRELEQLIRDYCVRWLGPESDA